MLKREPGLVLAVVTAALFMVFGSGWMPGLGADTRTLALFAWLFVVMLVAAFGVVRHADCLAIRLGEPYGTLILTLSVISIEVIMISAVMLTGSENPELGRDMMFAVIMIVLNGLIGLSLLIGGLKHIEQRFNLQGANTFLAVLIPLSFLALLLPNFTVSTDVGTLSKPQMVFLSVATLALYGTFLAAQTMRHSGYFMAPPREGDSSAAAAAHAHEGLDVRGVPFHTAMLIAYMLPIVLLSKSMAKIIDFGIAQVGAPAALGGLLVAILVLSPEGMAALKAARDDQLQRSINICLGSGLATIGLTVPAIVAISLYLDLPIVLGLAGTEALLLVLTALVAVVNFAGGRANMIHGLVHLILFAAYVVLIFD